MQLQKPFFDVLFGTVLEWTLEVPRSTDMLPLGPRAPRRQQQLAARAVPTPVALLIMRLQLVLLPKSSRAQRALEIIIQMHTAHVPLQVESPLEAPLAKAALKAQARGRVDLSEMTVELGFGGIEPIALGTEQRVGVHFGLY